jgi:hypothetical protein
VDASSTAARKIPATKKLRESGPLAASIEWTMSAGKLRRIFLGA